VRLDFAKKESRLANSVIPHQKESEGYEEYLINLEEYV